ncbi:MAG TPA: MlaD family protein [Solirubrobacterales bacterium]|nr:MlaD family protein [Solirubrobacterales bacterium]
MGRGGRVQSLAASPTLVGAITTLIVVVAVFLAYNASNGLPFVPVYRVSVELPNAQRVQVNNEVRIGGSRIGIVEDITPTRDQQGRTVAKLDLKLDKTVEPLPEDTEVRIRYKSSFGLKYVELVRGNGKGLQEGGTLPVDQSSVQTEFDDIANTFDEQTRTAVRQNLAGYGTAFAARGASLNETIQNLNPLFANLKPVAETLIDEDTRLERFFPALGRTAAIVAPVAEEQAALFGNMADTFGALAADPEALKATISSGPPTLDEGADALAVQTPFLNDFADLSADLRPGVQALSAALPTLNEALIAGAPVLARTPPVNAQLGRTLAAIENLAELPQTKTSLLRLRETFNTAAPLARFVAPYQTVCNYWNYWFTFLPEHLTERDSIGYTQRVTVIGFGEPQSSETNLAGYSGLQANGRAGPLGILAGHPPGEFAPREFPILHGNPYSPALNKNGTADCQSGQTGYVLSGAEAYRLPGQAAESPAFAVSNISGSRGPTFAGRNRLPGKLQPRRIP